MGHFKYFLTGSIGMAAVSLALFLTSTSLTAQSADQIIGSESCAACHPAQYAAWQKSAHAQATLALNDLQKLDKRCTQCHATIGAGVDPTKPNGIDNITCERCHGPGKYYASANVMKDKELRSLVGLRQPDEQMCTICHSESSPSIRSFNFGEFFTKIKHENTAN